MDLPEADDRTPEQEECQVDVGSALVAHAQPAELVEPGHSALYNPAVSVQPVLALDADAGDPGRDTSRLERLPAVLLVVGSVGVKLLWPQAKPSRSAISNGRNGIDGFLQQLVVVDVGC